ncbi:unnamed protein product [Symbiodinium sp. KB8]|nr:unnamed protein product [Symbiodinium sp. KB8]
MQKLGLPPASQWHTDWAPGLGAAGRSVLPSIVHVLSTLVEAVDLWTDRSDEENSFHLFTSPGNTASFPTCPDDWMVDRMPKMFRVRAAGLGVKMLPCIQRLVEDAKRMPCIAERHKGRTRAFFMKTGTPAALPDATVERCWQQLQTKNLQELHALLTQHGLVKEMADGNKKMVYEAFCESWVEHCCVIHEQHRSRSTQVGDVQCSCWHYRRRGHCPHAYFVLQSRLGFKSWVPEVLPSAKAAPDALDMQSGGSSVEASKPGRSCPACDEASHIAAAASCKDKAEPPRETGDDLMQVKQASAVETRPDMPSRETFFQERLVEFQETMASKSEQDFLALVGVLEKVLRATMKPDTHSVCGLFGELQWRWQLALVRGSDEVVLSLARLGDSITASVSDFELPVFRHQTWIPDEIQLARCHFAIESMLVQTTPVIKVDQPSLVRSADSLLRAWGNMDERAFQEPFAAT